MLQEVEKESSFIDTSPLSLVAASIPTLSKALVPRLRGRVTGSRSFTAGFEEVVLEMVKTEKSKRL